MHAFVYVRKMILAASSLYLLVTLVSCDGQCIDGCGVLGFQDTTEIVVEIGQSICIQPCKSYEGKELTGYTYYSKYNAEYLKIGDNKHQYRNKNWAKLLYIFYLKYRFYLYERPRTCGPGKDKCVTSIMFQSSFSFRAYLGSCNTTQCTVITEENLQPTTTGNSTTTLTTVKSTTNFSISNPDNKVTCLAVPGA